MKKKMFAAVCLCVCMGTALWAEGGRSFNDTTRSLKASVNSRSIGVKERPDAEVNNDQSQNSVIVNVVTCPNFSGQWKLLVTCDFMRRFNPL